MSKGTVPKVETITHSFDIEKNQGTEGAHITKHLSLWHTLND